MYNTPHPRVGVWTPSSLPLSPFLPLPQPPKDLINLLVRASLSVMPAQRTGASCEGRLSSCWQLHLCLRSHSNLRLRHPSCSRQVPKAPRSIKKRMPRASDDLILDRRAIEQPLRARVAGPVAAAAVEAHALLSSHAGAQLLGLDVGGGALEVELLLRARRGGMNRTHGA